MPPFVYQNTPNPYAASIGELLLRPGEIAAQRAEAVAKAQADSVRASGAAWAGAASNIGADVSGAVDTLTDPRRQLAAQQVADTKRNQQFSTVTNGIVSNLMQQNPDGSNTVDRAKAQQLFAAQNVPLPLQAAAFKNLDDVDASVKTFQKSKIDHAADLAHSAIGMIDAGMDPHTAVSTVVAYAKANGLGTDQSLAPIIQAVTSTDNPDDIKRVLGGIRGLSENYKDADKGIVLPSTPEGGAPATLVTPGGRTIATGGIASPKPVTEAETKHNAYIASLNLAPGQTPTSAQVAAEPSWQASQAPATKEQKPVLLDGKPALVSVDSKTGKSFDAAGNDVSARIKPIPTAAQVSITAGQLTDAALEQQTDAYLATGKLPQGYGPAATMRNTAIMNNAAKRDPGAALARNTAVFKADSANLTNLQKTEGTLSAFESTAGKNLDNFIEKASKIPDTGVPWLNTPVRLLSDKMLGSPDMVAAKAAGDVALREIARVTNDPKLSGALTDSARGEVQGLMNSQNATLPQILAVAKVLKQDMANVHAGITQQIDTVKNGIGSNPAAPAPPQPTTPAGQVPAAPAGWKYVPKPGGGWTAVQANP